MHAMSKRSWAALAAGTFLLCAASVASGQSEKSESEMDIAGETLPMEAVRDARFRFLDLDGDGYVTRKEIDEGHAVLRSQFPSLDADNDERLSEEEYVKFSRPE